MRSTRRGFLGTCLAAIGAPPVQEKKKLRVAAVVTEYRDNSHADVIIGKILEGFDQLGGPGPALRVASMVTDQVPKNDMSRALAAKHGFPIVKTIGEAITLGGKRVAVDGVLLIGEHGNYPYTPDTRQHLYPRKRFFDETAEAFRRGGRVVPVFQDKHLSTSWAEAREMVDTARRMKIPFMGGSSLPVAWRIPPLTLPRDCEIEEALAIGYGGPESYGFHALETLQCMVERRKGGETGVAAVQAVQGKAIWDAAGKGRWSRELLEAALDRLPNVREGSREERLRKNSPFYFIEYRDGLKATLAMINGIANEFGFAAKLKGRREPVATWFRLQEGKPWAHFGYLVRAIEKMVHTGKPSYPVERTLLTTGILDTAMHSLAGENRRIETPQLDVRYTPADWPHAPGVPAPPRPR